MPHADEEGMRDDFEVEIIDLPLDMPDQVAHDDESFKQASPARRFGGKPERAIASEDEDFALEITDLPPDDEPVLFSVLSDLWQRLLGRLPEIRVSLKSREEPDDDEGEFSLTVRDLPLEAEAGEKTGRAEVPVQAKKSLWRSKSVLTRPLLALGVVLLVVLVILPASMPFLQRDVLSHLFPPSQAAQPAPTSTRPAQSRLYICWGGSMFLVIDGTINMKNPPPPDSFDRMSPSKCPTESGSTGITSGSDNVAAVPTPSGPPIGAVPTNCQPGSDVTDAHTIGGRPVWVSGFDGPQATIHLGDTPQTVISGKVGWSVVTTIWMHFDQDLRVTFSSGNQLGSGPAPLFKFDLEDPLTQSLSFRSHHPSIPDYAGKLTNNWFMTMYFPAAGCYVLNASWPNNGGWHLNFAVGR